MKRRRTSQQPASLKLRPPFDFSAPPRGHSSPSHCPPRCPQTSERLGDANPLGTPLTIGGVADLIGCSPWTVRRKYLPIGLPHLRVGPSGKLLFYNTLVTRWLMRRQKGEKS